MDFDGKIDGDFVFQNKDHYEEPGYYLIQDGTINGHPETPETLLSVTYSQLYAYIDSSVVYNNSVDIIDIKSNVEHDGTLHLIGLNNESSLTLNSSGNKATGSGNSKKLRFANILLYGTEQHAASLFVDHLNLNLNMEGVTGEKNGDFSYGGAVIANQLNTKDTNNRNALVYFQDSNVVINLDIGKYTKGYAAGIMLSGYQQYHAEKDSLLSVENSSLSIDSSLQGIMLVNANLNVTGTSSLSINAGTGLGKEGISLNASNNHEGAGLLIGSALNSTHSGKAAPIEVILHANEINIHGVNGIDIIKYTKGQFSSGTGTVHLSLDNVLSNISAIDSHGHFANTYALNAQLNKEAADSSIAFAGNLHFANHQTVSPEITENYYDDTNIFGLNIEYFDLQTLNSDKADTNVNIEVSSQGLTKTPHVYGLHAANSRLTFNHPLSVTATGQMEGSTVGIALESSTFDANNTINVVAQKQDGSLGTALDITGSQVNISSPTITAKSAAASQITGNINVNDKSTLAINRNDPFTIFGAITTAQTGESNLTLSNSNSRWVVSGDSNVDSLTLEGALLSFDTTLGTRAADLSEYHQLQTKNLSLEDGTLQVRVDLSGDETLTDQIHAATVSGNGIADIRLVGNVTEHKAMSDGVGFLYQDEGTLTLQLPDRNNDGTPDQVIYQNGGLMGWKLTYQATDATPDAPEANSLAELPEMSDTAVTGSGKGYWYLTTGDYAELPDEPDPTPDPTPDPNPEPLPPEVQQIQNLGSSVAQAVGWLSEKNDLRRRLGEVRYGSQAGAWAKVFNRQDRAQGFRYNGFKQESTGVHIGYDTFVSRNDNASWLVGATLRYAHSKQEGLETAYGGDGKLDEYSGKVYATWIHQSGAYVDVLAQVGYYDQEIIGLNNSAENVFNANYHNWAWGTSVEIGHKLMLGDGAPDRTDRWFIEPQLEMSYYFVKGSDFTTSTGMKVSQGNADFLTGRAGFVLGKKVNYGPADNSEKRWYQVGLIGGVTHEFLGDQTIRFTGSDGAIANVKGHGLGGTSFYYGVTADWQISENLRLYGELDREEGDHYTKDYGVNVGFKYAF